ncbi:zinc finger HIT domain-containing protein 1 [Sitophilus oryzae]|uniref:Zinc finger HIT domain-containing protein 1 n=1 Tax=Sitophilus oryzae TaxID=7048 RepID=A0A6J2XTD0_SITOR|nr:zinc finger HIT domain-containing protein 1 [Sitophilus oryzae]
MTISKGTLRGSNRIKENDKRRIIDESQRKRRQRKVMEMLESDNYHDDPHADLVMSKKVPKFEDNLEQRSSRTKRKERSVDYYQFKYRKNFQQLVDEDRAESEAKQRPSYMDIQCGESQLPSRHFCAVCGFLGQYNCLSCGTRYCSIRCMETHMDTRCLKWAG